MTSIGDQLREAREKAGLDKTELQHRSGVARQVIARIETGETQPRVDTLMKLGQALGTIFVVGSKTRTKN